jgi:hypothetical protein
MWTVIAIWVLVSFALGPVIGRFAGFNRLDKD